jgi:hypothetical protein
LYNLDIGIKKIRSFEEKPLKRRNKMSKKWELYVGCHRHTLTSRDSTLREHDSLEDCKRDVAELEASYRSMGYCVWFAYAIAPNGEKVVLHKGTPCH